MLILHNLWISVFIASLLIEGCGCANCVSRRCLAQMLSEKKHLTQPQSDNCTLVVDVPLIVYQTISVDTKELRLNSLIYATMRWTDPDLSWDTSVYPFEEVVIPVSDVWYPVLKVTNGITTTMKHDSRDLLVSSNGTLTHDVTITSSIDCEVNLFNYPFANDECPVAIQAWSSDNCGIMLVMGELRMIDGSHGDWETVTVSLANLRDDRNYIMVALSIKYLNSFITLVLPSLLIIVADVVSFALPLSGGERNSFKVTLVLSFTMFLVILNNLLPGDSQCSPFIRTHFCICLVLLVVSMLVSMVLTGLSVNGSLIFCGKKSKGNKKEPEDEVQQESKVDSSVIQMDPTDQSALLRKVVNFLEAVQAKELECERYQKLAQKLDKVVFWIYTCLTIAYVCVMFYVMVKHRCEINHFGFWE